MQDIQSLEPTPAFRLGHHAASLSLLVAAVSLALAQPAWALGLGEIQHQSGLGQPLQLVIPVTLGEGESLDPGCVHLTDPQNADLPTVRQAQISWEGEGSSLKLKVRSPSPVNEPALTVALAFDCPSAARLVRDYTLLLTPAEMEPIRVVASNNPVQVGKRSADPVLQKTHGRNQSLLKMAKQQYPRKRGLQARFIHAAQRLNPELKLSPYDRIPETTELKVPTWADMREQRRLELSPMASTAVTATPRAETPPSAQAAANPAPAPSSKTNASEGFKVKVSKAELDPKTAGKNNFLSEAEKMRQRELEAQQQSENQVAELLQLKDKVKKLEAQLQQAQQTQTTPAQINTAVLPSADKKPSAADSASTSSAPSAAGAPLPQQNANTSGPTLKTVTAPAPAPDAEKPLAVTTTNSKVNWSLMLKVLAAILVPLAILFWLYHRHQNKPLTRRWESDPFTELDVEDPRPSTTTPEPSVKTPDDPEHVPPAAVFEPKVEGVEVSHEDEAEPAAVPPSSLLKTSPPVAPPPKPVAAAAVAQAMPHPSAQASGARQNRPTAPVGSKPLANLEVEQPRWVAEEAQLFLSHGLVDHAVSLLEDEIGKSPYEVDLWVLLFEIHHKERHTEAFSALFNRFRSISEGTSVWDKVRTLGQEIDPNNPDYQG